MALNRVSNPRERTHPAVQSCVSWLRPPEDHITATARPTWLLGATAAGDPLTGEKAQDEALARATRRAYELGCAPLPPAAGALLSVLAAALHARAVVEVGTCAGIASHWLLRGMPRDGVLTVIDPRSEHLRAAQRTYADAGLAPGRTRTIAGSPDQVLPRLADAAYDLVLIGGDPRTWHAYTVEALRLLRPGGILVVDGTSVGERSDAADDAAVARDLARAVWDDDRLLPALVPIGDGLLLAVANGS